MSLTPINEDSALYPSVDQRPDENILDNEGMIA